MDIFSPDNVAIPSGHFIGGELVTDRQAPAIEVNRPSDGKPCARLPLADAAMVDLAVQNAQDAWRSGDWARGAPGIFNVVQGDGRTAGDALARHPLVKKMTFTGSTATGAAIMASCAKYGPKPVTLEPGGKSPQFVFDDVPDVERLAGIVARAITGNGGQVCVAGSRLIVQRRVAAEPHHRGRNGVDQPLWPQRRLCDPDRGLSPIRHRQGPRPPGGRGEPAPQERADRFRGVMRCIAHACRARGTACRARPAKRQLRRRESLNSPYAHGGPVMQ